MTRRKKESKSTFNAGAGSYLVHLRKTRPSRKTARGVDGLKHIYTKALCGEYVLPREAVREAVKLLNAVCPDCMKLAKSA